MNRFLRMTPAVILVSGLIAGCAPQAAAQPTAPAASPTPTAADTAPAPPAATVTTGSPSDSRTGQTSESIEVGGMTRSYLLYIPAGYDGSEALPLVLLLHGYSDSAENMVKWSAMNDKADAEHFIAVYLEGSGSPRAWNTGIVPGLAAEADDVGFARAVIDRMEARLKIDPRRVYAAGASMGAMMTFRLAAELSDWLAAAAMQAGTVGTTDRGGTVRTVATTGGPIPIVTFHGKLDATVPFDGGEGDAGAQLSWMSVAESTEFWLKRDGCVGPPKSTVGGNGLIVQEDYTDCQAGGEVLVYTLVKGDHYWTTLADDGLSTTDAIWDFFKRHTLGG